MEIVYALLVGIDRYALPEIPPLSGAVADVAAVEEFLQARVTGELRTLALRDEQATRDAVVAGFREHLAAAGPGDVALFWYSGHGSEQPVAPQFAHLEPTGTSQSVVCHDSRGGGVPDLTDKELSALLDAVAAGGVHVVAVLDCCHSGGGTRAPEVTYRGLPASGSAPSGYVRELVDPPARREAHVALSACQPFEKAREQRVDGRMRGVFSAALLGALRTLAACATYRELLTAARARVEDAAGEQVPVLYPVTPDGPADQPFLGGTARAAAGFTLRHGHAGWEVDGGHCHGIPETTADDPVLFAVRDEGVLQATAVRPASTTVQPVGWQPDPQRLYPVVLAAAPDPPATVVLGGLPDDDPAALDLVRQAVDTGPSAHVRIVAEGSSAPGLRLRVATAGRGFRILRGDGAPATADVPGRTAAAALVVAARLDHIARWTRLKDLDNRGSSVAGAVRVEIAPVLPGHGPLDCPTLLPDERGEIVLRYAGGPDGWTHPEVFVRLRNTTPHRLWCVLLDLTDRYRAHASLFPGAWVGPHLAAAAYEGDPIPVTLPPDTPPEPGARVRDWLKLIVSDEPFDSAAFDLPRLDAPIEGTRDLPTRTITASRPDTAPTADWATSVVSLVTEVPAG